MKTFLKHVAELVVALLAVLIVVVTLAHDPIIQDVTRWILIALGVSK